MFHRLLYQVTDLLSAHDLFCAISSLTSVPFGGLTTILVDDLEVEAINIHVAYTYFS